MRNSGLRISLRLYLHEKMVYFNNDYELPGDNDGPKGLKVTHEEE